MAPLSTTERSLKERNTQRRKRKRTLEDKVKQMAELCDFDVALMMRNRESGEKYSFRSRDLWRSSIGEFLADPKSQNKLPIDIEKFKRQKERGLHVTKRKRSRKESRRAASEEAASEESSIEDKMSNKVAPRGRVNRAAPFLPEPPSFDVTVFKNAYVG